jgi:hypothetical protein
MDRSVEIEVEEGEMNDVADPYGQNSYISGSECRI